MPYRIKEFRKSNFFILYDLEDNIICYFDNFKELSRIFNYKVRDLVHEFNRHSSDRIIVVINNQKYRLITFTD